MGTRLVALGTGVVFGLMLSWSRLSDPEVIRRALLFEDSYLFLLFGSAVATAFAGQWLLRRVRARALLTGEPVGWSNPEPARAHVAGSVLFGVGWGVSGSCPGPIASQLGQGVAWSLFTLAGLLIGIVLYLRTERRRQAGAGTFARPPRRRPRLGFGSTMSARKRPV